MERKKLMFAISILQIWGRKPCSRAAGHRGKGYDFIGKFYVKRFVFTYYFTVPPPS